MTRHPWWAARRRPRWSRWFSIGGAHPEDALLLRYNRREPTSGGVINVNRPLSASASILNLSQEHNPNTAVCVSLRPRPATSPRHDLTGIVAPHSRGGAGSEVSREPRLPEGGPRLADRLRIILAVPLDHLLQGKLTVLDWPAPLMPFQCDGVRELVSRDRLLLADDMGLGKTVQAIAALRILFVQGVVESALIVTPASLVDQWRRELRRWAPELRALPVRGPSRDRSWQWEAESHVKLVSYETLRSDYGKLTQSAARGEKWDVVILDEAQKIKNPEIEISRVVKGLKRTRSWALTGTPLENRIEDLVSIMGFVDMPEVGSATHQRELQQVLGRHRELQLRRRKSDVLMELPPKQIIERTIELSPPQSHAYKQAEEEGIIELRERGETVRIEHVLGLITRLKQICNFDPGTGESTKLTEIKDRLETLASEGHRALLFSQYTDDTFGIGAISKQLQEFEPLVFTGAMSGTERDRAIQKFKTDRRHKVLLLSLKAGGLGLNLQDASYVFHFDRWWNPAVERQAEDRSHRIGQTVPVTVFNFTCLGTIEERIQGLLSEKQKLFDELVDDVTLEIDKTLKSRELFGLFGLEPPRLEPPQGTSGQSGIALELRCQRILAARGWSVEMTPRSRDGGIDLIALKADEIGIERTLYVQCKDHARPVGVEVVRELLGVITPGKNVQAVLSSPSGVTADGASLAQERGVRIWDEQILRSLEEGSG